MSEATETGAFAAAMSAAMKHAAITLTDLRDQLAAHGHPISLTALSYWRSGLRLPERQASLDALPTLESLLGVEPGELARLVAGPAARRLGRVTPFDGLLDYPVMDPVAGEDFHGESDVSRISTQVTVQVGADGGVSATRVRRLVIANRDGVEGITVFMGTDEERGMGDYRFRAVAGCSIYEDRPSANNVRRVQLRFPRPLKLGESALTEVEVTTAADAPIDRTDDYELVAEQRLEEALIWVNFDPGAPPSRCWLYFSERGLKHEWQVEIDAPSVHYRQRDFGPGALGIRWEW